MVNYHVVLVLALQNKEMKQIVQFNMMRYEEI